MSTIRKLVSLSAVIAASIAGSTSAGAQSNEPVDLSVAEHEKAAVVWDVLTYEFEKVEAPTRVRLSMHGINIAWIPVIPNVEFVLLSETELLEAGSSCEPYWYFEEFGRDKRRITVSFGYGTRCSSHGRVYAFVYRRGRLTFDGRGFGVFGSSVSHCDCPEHEPKQGGCTAGPAAKY